MPIYTYDCPVDGATDVFTRTVGPPFEMDCPNCPGQMANVIAAPAVVNVKLDWNDKASDYRRDPYTQAKAQLTNISRAAADRGESHSPITEEAIQVGAKAIDGAARNPHPDAQQRQIQQIRQDQRVRRQKQND